MAPQFAVGESLIGLGAGRVFGVLFEVPLIGAPINESGSILSLRLLFVHDDVDAAFVVEQLVCQLSFAVYTCFGRLSQERPRGEHAFRRPGDD